MAERHVPLLPAPRAKKFLKQKIPMIDPAGNPGEKNRIAAGNADDGAANSRRHRQRCEVQSSTRKDDQVMPGGRVRWVEIGDGVEPVAGVAVVENVGTAATGPRPYMLARRPCSSGLLCPSRGSVPARSRWMLARWRTIT